MAIVSFQSDISHSSINRTTMATENASGGGASDRTPKAGTTKKGILTRKGGGGGDGDDGHSVISGVTQNTLTTLTASEKAAETVGGPGGNLLAHDDDSTMPTKMTTVNAMPGRTASTRSGMQHGAVIDTIPENGQGTMHVAPPPAANAHWLEKYRFPLRDVHVKTRVSNSVVLNTKLGELEQTREIILRSTPLQRSRAWSLLPPLLPGLVCLS